MGKNKGSAPVIVLLIIIIILLSTGIYLFLIKDSSKKQEDKKETTFNNSPTLNNAGVLSTPTLIPLIETKPSSPVPQTSPTLLIVTKPNASPIPSRNPEIPETPKSIVPKSTKVLNKKIFLVIYNPKVDNRTTTSRFGWNNPDTLTTEVISFFKEVTNNRVNYLVTKRQVLETFPIKIDKFNYTSETYKKCVDSSNRSADCHNPDTADYLEILKTTGACELLNNGQIDELWIWGGPYFGFYESNIAGPKAFFVNSGPTKGSTCQKVLPIMGFNYERGLNEAVHNFGHRAESIMKEVYGSWSPQATHSWNKFSLLDKDVRYFAGCGNIHFPPNSNKEYTYNVKSSVKSNCEEFYNFPEIKGIHKDVSCTDWGCNELGYYKYWWKYFPQNEGKSRDSYTNKEIYNNWLLYVFDFAWIN